MEAAARLAAAAIDLPWLEARGEAWDRLAARAAAPTPFFSRHFIKAHAACGLTPGRLRFIAVSDGEALAALLPFVPDARGLGLARGRAAWRSAYVTGTTPLVDAGRLQPALRALLEGMAAEAPLWTLPLLPLETPVARALQAALAEGGWRQAVVAPFPRAVLLQREGAADILPPSRRKSLARRRARLEARGRLEHRVETAGPGLAGAVESFLALEAAGWKGARGTALASHPRTAALARALFRDGPGPAGARADLLLLDGRPLAASLALVAGGTAYLMKTAYDEAFAPFAPGLLLEAAIMRDFQATRFCERLDSASLPGSVLEDFYPDRERIADLVIAAPALGPRRFAAILAADALRRRTRQTLKRWRDGLGRS